MKRQAILGVLAVFIFLISMAKANAETIVSSNIRSDTTWTLDGSPYIVTTTITLSSSSANQSVGLTIEPGVEVRFDEGARLYVGDYRSYNSYYGWIHAVGTTDNPIVFTANSDTPTPGYWSGLYFKDQNLDNSTLLDHVIIEYGLPNVFATNTILSIKNSEIRFSGNHGIQIADNANITIGGVDAGNNIYQNASYGIYQADSSVSLNIGHNNIYENGSVALRVGVNGNVYANSIHDNGYDEIQTWGGKMTSAVTWRNQDVPIVVLATITVRASAANQATGLTIEPGMEIRFNQNTMIYMGEYYSYNNYYGWINAAGTTENPITFTANSDEPTPGFWGGLHFRDQTSDASVVLDHIVVEYGQPNIYATNATFSIINSEIRYSGSIGIHIDNSANITVGGEDQGNSIYQNTTFGIYQADSGVVLNVGHNEIYENGSVPLRVSNTSNTFSNSIHGNGQDVIQVWGGRLNRDVTWTNQNVPVVVLATITIRSASANQTAGLTIEPDMEIRFNQNTMLYIGEYYSYNNYNGWINAVGTAEDPIVFTANSDEPTAGFWGGLHFRDQTTDASVVLDHVVIEYGQPNIYATNATFSVTNSEIRYSGSIGIHIDNNANITVGGEDQGNSIYQNTTYGIFQADSAISLDIGHNEIYENGGIPLYLGRNFNAYSNSIHDNGDDVLQTRGGQLDKTVTWYNQNVPIIVTSTITVRATTANQNVGLTIEPGIEVRFNQNTKIYFGQYANYNHYYGWINAAGTAENPITFTANSDEPTPGFWGGLSFRNETTDESVVLDHVIIEYGQPNLYAYDAVFAITNSELRYSGSMGIHIANNANITVGGVDQGNKIHENTTYGIYQDDSGIMPDIGNNDIYENGGVALLMGRNMNVHDNSIYDNGTNRIQVRGGTLTATTTWHNQITPVPIEPLAEITIRASAANQSAGLTIEPGVEILCNQNFRFILGIYTSYNNYYGWINATGTPDRPIVFTPNTDEPTPGFWKGIYFRDQTNDTLSVLSHVEMHYAGQEGTAAIYLASASPTITDTLIEHSATYGIYADDGALDATIANNTFLNNGAAPISVLPNAVGTIHGNTGQGRITIRGGTQTRTVTLHKQDLDFAVSGSITVRSSSANQSSGLTIEPGTRILFNAGTYIHVGLYTSYNNYYGWINATGTANNPIVFTANTTEPTPGFWGGLNFRDQTNDSLTILDHVIVEYGQPNISATNAAITLKNSDIRFSGTHGLQFSENSWGTIGTEDSGNRIYRNSSYGIYQDNGNGVPAVSYNEIYENGGIAALLGRNFNAYENIIHDNGADEVQTWGGYLDRDVTWHNQNVPIVVLNSITVRGASANQTVGLTIEPGTEIRFNQGKTLIFGIYTSYNNYYGWINATGTADSPILFTANASPPSKGFWNGIYFRDQTSDASTVLDHVIVEYAGYSSNANIYAESAAVTIQNSIIRHSSNTGIYLDDGSNGTTIADNDFYDNTVAAISGLPNAANNMSGNAGEGRIHIRGGNFTLSSGTWRRQGLDFEVTGSVTVRGASANQTSVLTIEPGVNVRFCTGTNISFGIYTSYNNHYGALWAKGLENLPIRFSSASDLPAPGDWNGLYFRTYTADSSTTMENCVVEYAGTNVYVDNANFTFKNNTLQYGSANGLTTNGGQVDGMLLECNNFKGNNIGVSITGGADPRLLNNNFIGNIQDGVNNSGSTSAIDAINNWWNDPDGPTTGDPATGAVLYEPVLTEPSTCVSLPPDNFPPYSPMHPTPEDGATNVALDEANNLQLSWRGGDPDPADEILYDVYFSTDPEALVLVAQDLTDMSYLATNLSVGMRYYWRVVAKDGAENETQGAVWQFVTAGPPPDLALSALEIDVPEDGVFSGMETTIRVTVTNIGAGPVSIPFPTSLNVDQALYETQLIDRVMITDEAETLTFTWIAKAGTHTGVFAVDPDNIVEESDETNNTLSFDLPEIPFPDLIVSDIALLTESPVQGEIATVQVTLDNLGAATVKDLLVELESRGATFSNWQFGGLTNGEFPTLDFDVPTPAGDFSVTTFVDATNLVTESDEGNNSLTQSLAIIPYPDLTGMALVVDPPSPYINETVTVSLSLGNEGEGGTVLPFDVALYVDQIKTDTFRVNDPLRTAEDNVPVALEWVAQPGTHTLDVRIDEKLEVEESDEEDNIIVVGELEMLLPDYIPTLSSFRPEQISQGESVYFTATVENQGEGANIIPPKVRFHIDESAFNTTEMLHWLEPGALAQVTNDTAWRAQAGEHCYTIIVNPDGSMPEANLENNTITDCLPLIEQPDLSLISLTYDPADLVLGNVISFSATVKNVGTGDTWLPFKIALYANNSRQAGAKTVEILEVNQEQIVTLPWRVASGDWTIKVVADADNQVEEFDETNNTTEVILPHIYSKPDITVSLDDYQGEKVWGERSVSWTASHAEQVEISRVRIYARHNGDTLLIDTTEAQGAVPWDTATFPDGTYRLRGIVTDANGAEDEFLTGAFDVKNSRSIALIVSPSNSQTGRINQEIDFQLTVRNDQPEEDRIVFSQSSSDSNYSLQFDDPTLMIPAWSSASTTLRSTVDTTGDVTYTVYAVPDYDNGMTQEIQLTVHITEPFQFSLSPGNINTSLGDSLAYSIILTNQLTIADTYGFSVSGFPEGWVTAPDPITLSPGETKVVSMIVDEIDQTGDFELSVETTSTETGAMKSASSTLSAVADPKITWLWPENGYRSGSDRILIQWETNVPTLATTNVRIEGDTEWTSYDAQDGLFHGVWVEGLQRNTTYEYYVESTNDFGSAVSTERSFTISNGVVFAENSHSFSMYRGKSKEFSISVRNTDSIPHQIMAYILDPPEDLNVGIIGTGSGSDEGQTLIVPSGGVASLTLAAHAQDSLLDDYAFSLNLETVGEEPTIFDQTQVAIHIQDMAVDFAVSYVSENSATLSQRYRITNRGTAINDLNVALDDVLAEGAVVVPLLDHAFLDEGGTLEFDVIPDITPPFSAIGGTMTVTGGGRSIEKTLTFSLPPSYSNFAYRLSEADCGFYPPEGTFTTEDFDNRYISFTWEVDRTNSVSWSIDDREEELYEPTEEELVAGLHVFDANTSMILNENTLTFTFDGLVLNPYTDPGDDVPMVRRRIIWSSSVESATTDSSIMAVFDSTEAFESYLNLQDAVGAADKTQQEKMELYWATKASSDLSAIIAMGSSQDPLLEFAAATLKNWVADSTGPWQFMGLFEKVSTGANSYTTNRQRVESTVATPSGLAPEDLTSAYLGFHFSPQSHLTPHDVDIFFNDWLVGNFRQDAPRGYFFYGLEAYQVFFGLGATNQVAVTIYNNKPGEYSILYDFSLLFTLLDLSVSYVATSEVEALQELCGTYTDLLRRTDMAAYETSIVLPESTTLVNRETTIDLTVFNRGSVAGVALANLSIGEATVWEDFVYVPGLGRTDFPVNWTPEEAGNQSIVLSLIAFGPDRDDTNDQVSTSITIVDQLTHELTVAITPPDTGSVQGTGIACPDDCSETIIDSEVAELQAEPHAGYEFIGWKGDTTSTDPYLQVTMDSPKSYLAEFACIELAQPVLVTDVEGVYNEVPYNLSWEPVDVATGYIFQEGMDPDFLAWDEIPTETLIQEYEKSVDTPTIFYYRVKAVSTCGESVWSNTVSIAVSNHHLYTLDVAVAGSGSIEGTGIVCPEDCQENIEETFSVSLEAIPDYAHAFVQWNVAGSETPVFDNPYIFDMAGDTNATAVFECFQPDPTIAQTSASQVEWLEPYTISWTAVDYAEGYEIEESLSPDFSDPTIIQTANIEQNYQHEVDVDATYYYRVKASTPCTLTSVSETVSVTVLARDEYTVTVFINGGGTIEGSGLACPGTCQATYYENVAVTFTATADQGWRFDRWEGDIQQTQADVSIEAILQNYTLTAVFEMIEPAIQVEPTVIDFGDVSVSGNGAYRDIVITNTGGAPLAVTSIGMTTGTPYSFSLISETCTRSPLARNENCTLQVRFSPNRAEQVQGGLSIRSNDPNQNEVVVNLDGRGVIEVLPLRVVLFKADPAEGTSPLTTVLSWNIVGGTRPYDCEIFIDGASKYQIADCLPEDEIEHEFIETGLYMVELTVMDDDEEESGAALEVNVTSEDIEEGDVDEEVQPGDIDEVDEVEYELTEDEEVDEESEIESVELDDELTDDENIEEIEELQSETEEGIEETEEILEPGDDDSMEQTEDDEQAGDQDFTGDDHVGVVGGDSGLCKSVGTTWSQFVPLIILVLLGLVRFRRWRREQ